MSEQGRMDRGTLTSNYQCSLGGQQSLNWSGITFVGAPRLVALLEDCVDAPRESLRALGGSWSTGTAPLSTTGSLDGIPIEGTQRQLRVRAHYTLFPGICSAPPT